jgi:hypothetical protein
MTVIPKNGILPMSSYGVPSGNTNFFGNDLGKIQIHYVMSFAPIPYILAMVQSGIIHVAFRIRQKCGINFSTK